jgi:hypothetical protein
MAELDYELSYKVNNAKQLFNDLLPVIEYLTDDEICTLVNKTVILTMLIR